MTPIPADERTAPDLSDPVVLAAQLEDFASGVDQQAVASRSGTALAGHPYPEFFFGRVAELMRRGAAALRKLPPSPAPEPTGTPEPPADAPKPPERARPKAER